MKSSARWGAASQTSHSTNNATASLARPRVEVEDKNSGGERRVGIPVRKTNKDPSTEM